MRRDFGTLPDTGAGSFQARLMPGEKILWRGAAGRGILLSRTDLIAIPFSLLWCGFAVFWLYNALRMGADTFFLIWGGAFVCVGLYVLFGRLVVDAWLRRHIDYAVTNRRILIIRSGPFSNFTSLNLSMLPDIQQSGNSRKGTLRFGAPATLNGRFTWTRALDPTPQFLGIEEPDKVLDIITQAANAGRRDG